MDCNDDIPGNVLTTATASLGEPFEGTFDLDACETDSDYIKVDLEYGRSYTLSNNIRKSRGGIFIPPSDSFLYNISVGDASDRHLPYTERYVLLGGRFLEKQFTFRTRFSGTHYIRVSGSDASQPYRVTMSEAPANRKSANYPHQPGYAAVDTLTDDIRSFDYQFDIVPGHEYELNVFGADGPIAYGTIADPRVSVTDGTVSARDDNGGFGRNASLRFIPQEWNATATVSGEANGDFHFHVRRLDTTDIGITTGSKINIGSTLQDFVDTALDIDWHRMMLAAGNWYTVSTSSQFPMTTLIRGTDLAIDDYRVDQTESSITFQAKSTGEHYLVARPSEFDQIGQYVVNLKQVGVPIEASQTERIVSIDGQVTHLADLIELNGLQPDVYELYANVPLIESGQTRSAREVFQIDGQSLTNWTHQNEAPDSNSISEVWIRATKDGSKSKWIKSVIHNKTNDIGLIGSSQWETFNADGKITFSYSENVPDYFGQQYSNASSAFSAFAPVTYGLDNLLAESSDADAQIRIFVADGVSGYVDAYSPGEGEGGDIILNSQFYGDTAPTRGSREHYELLRGMMVALGFQATAGSTSRQSVLSNELFAGVRVPFTLLPRDVQAIDSVYGVKVTPEGSQVASGFGILNPSHSNPTFDSVDMRENGWLAYTVDGEQVNGLSTFGGSADAKTYISGNSQTNFLRTTHGGWMDGREGDDYLTGNQSPNWFGYRFGEGNDIIRDGTDDNFGSPNDTLRVIGYGPFDVNLNDLRFTHVNHEDRLEDYFANQFNAGLDASLRIDLVNAWGDLEGSVTISQQELVGRRVESLELYYGNQELNRISLVNAFEQLSPGVSTEFSLAAGYDQWGQLVSPV